uniref:Restriction endonuclease n=1 Tax=Candidatus Kentrum sp. TUN TaxID=2126343 RepID=A0A451A9I1_9GAMM|nr:MAG: hypothetical protein BECKTUN1418D_GA0071000_11831 [Candidatus Kentron sp. TUN]
MNIQHFTFALDHARSSDWEHFEELCSRFLASEFPTLRTMANPTGDGGRDSELFYSSEEGLTVAFQYSLAKAWKAKISKTLKKIKDKFPHVRVLIYLSNKKIGANSDQIRKTCLDEGVSLDIRDLSWFSERMNIDDNKYKAAETFYQIIAEPLLKEQKVIEKNRPSLTTLESKAALTYLAMQWEDERTDKGLTKVVYEALTLSALRNTNSDSRMSRSNIHDVILG